MPNTVMLISFRLLKGASEPDFLQAAQKLQEEFMSKQKGYISWKQLKSDETWVDLLTFETLKDAQNIDEASCTNPLSHAYFSFIDMESIQAQFFSTVKEY